jgi:multidrug efflux pump subunit AcrA (membrane-fusion protein)
MPPFPTCQQLANRRVVGPTGHSKVIQPLEAGLVTAVHVRDGDHVAVGDVLIELDHTLNSADRRHVASDPLSAQPDVARLSALRAGIEAGTGPVGFRAPDRDVARTRVAMAAQVSEQVTKVAAIERQEARAIGAAGAGGRHGAAARGPRHRRRGDTGAAADDDRAVRQPPRGRGYGVEPRCRLRPSRRARGPGAALCGARLARSHANADRRQAGQSHSRDGGDGRDQDRVAARDRLSAVAAAAIQARKLERAMRGSVVRSFEVRGEWKMLSAKSVQKGIDAERPSIIWRCGSRGHPRQPLQARVWRFTRHTLISLAAKSFIFCLFYEIAFADDREDFESSLRSLHTAATSLTLIVVPKGFQFLMAITKDRLPMDSCLYDVASDGGDSFKEILELLANSTYLDETVKTAPQSTFDIRIGLIVKNGADVVQKFYFEDLTIGRTIRGYSSWNERSGRLRLGALTTFPDHLRAFVARPDVIAVNGGTSFCAPS